MSVPPEIFRYGWRGSHYAGSPVVDLWFAISRDPDGGYWFDAYLVGRLRVRGGAPHLADFARWLLAERPDGPYEAEFLLVADVPQEGLGGSWLPPGGTSPEWVDDLRMSVEILIGREAAGGPEFLQVIPLGHSVGKGFGFQPCAELECEPLDRPTLDRAAARLLADVGRFVDAGDPGDADGQR